MSDERIEAVAKALRRAYNLGKTFWQQADSESWTEQNKSDATQAKFNALVLETCSALSAPAGYKLVPIEPTVEMAQTLIDCADFERLCWPKSLSPNYALEAYRILVAAAPGSAA